MTRFNLNDKVRVRLNDNGRAILQKAWGAYCTPEQIVSMVDDDGYYTCQMWSLMQDFGPHIMMGKKPPFSTEIEVVA